jgi:dTDP-4-dehydrorhamnose 3,5-epimerase
MKRFQVNQTDMAGLLVVERQEIADARGSFSRLFCSEELRESGWAYPIAQINHTITSRRGAVRGLHFQRPPHAEAKQVTCIRGEVWDVAVDLRWKSPTFLRWHAEKLSAENRRSLIIPPGFAHGFQALSDGVELIYFHSTAYAPGHEAGLDVRDAKLAISWPLPIADLSSRDQAHPAIEPGFEGVKL